MIEDRAFADGWIRYTGVRANALMCDGSARSFLKGSITGRNVWRELHD